MSLHDMSVFAVGRRINLNIFAACIMLHCTLLHHPLLKYHREEVFVGKIIFQICYEYNVCKLNNILISSHLRDTNIIIIIIIIIMNTVYVLHAISPKARST